VEEGRRLSSFVDELSWPETEVKLFLKASSPVLALTAARDRVLELAESRVVYERKRHDDTDCARGLGRSDRSREGRPVPLEPARLLS
jgi:hypothetical protein